MPVRIPIRFPAALTAADDRTLLARFRSERDDAAFAAMVGRHARMVYGVCKRAVRDEHLAEDAFQAVFLVLAKNPDGAATASSLGGWLFGIARRVGLAAKRHEERYARRTAKSAAVSRPSESPDFDDLLRVLDEELAALPEVYRAPLVACFLEERTQDEAAKELGWSLSTLRRRLDRAKELLRAKLTRRGATLAAGLFAGALAPSARAAVPARLLEAATTAKVSPLAEQLAAQIGASFFVKVWMPFVAVAVTLGGLAVGLAGVHPEAPEPPRASANAPAVAPPPRVVERSAWVTVTGRVVFPEKLDLPKPRFVQPGSVKDEEFFGQPRVDDVIIDAKTRGIANAVVWLRPDSDDRKAAFPREKIHPDLVAVKRKDHDVTAGPDGFGPRVLAVRAGDRLVFANATPIAFNVHYSRNTAVAAPMGRDTGEFNVLLPTGKTHTTGPLPPLTTADTFVDHIHPWVKGFVWAFDHPYFAVTDAKGNFTIPSAPAGAWRVVVWHEKVGYLNGAKGRAGERVTVAGSGTMELPPRVFESDRWAE